MMAIFDFNNDLEILKHLLSLKEENQGRGQMKSFSEKYHIHSTTVSQIFSGTRPPTMEQAFFIADFFDLSDDEREYFLALVQANLAGNHQLTAYFRNKANEIKTRAQQIISKVKKDIDLSIEQKSRFYSSWEYSAVRNAIAIENVTTAEVIAKNLGISKKRTNEIINFLLDSGLLKRKPKLSVGPKLTHLEPDSPLIKTHHSNWRLKNLETVTNLTESELMYTCPCSISAEDAVKFRKRLLDLIAEFQKILAPSPSEELFCFAIDWVKFSQR